jgi:phosphoglycolate phosphatase
MENTEPVNPVIPPIRLVALDMAGTTVSDDGVVSGPSAGPSTGGRRRPTTARWATPTTFVQRTMGQSKIAVFTELFSGDSGQGPSGPTPPSRRPTTTPSTGGEIAPLPGAAEAMAALRAAGVKVCLTTGFAPATRERILDALGWTGSVDLALSPVDAGRGRPWPDMILTAVIRLQDRGRPPGGGGR